LRIPLSTKKRLYVFVTDHTVEFFSLTKCALIFNSNFGLIIRKQGSKKETVMKKEFFLGIDMGGTAVKTAIVDGSASILEQKTIPMDIKADPKQILKTVLEAAGEFKDYDKVKNIGLGTAGDVDSNKGILRYAYNLPKWKNTPIKQILRQLSKREVLIDNDANTAALGAFWLDAKGRADNLVCVTLGTGVGGGIVINKKLYRGSSLSAGEIGHQTIKFDGPACNCGNIGCAEAYLGAKNFTRHSIEYVKNHKSKIIMDLIEGDYLKLTPEILYKAAVKNDKTALELWKWGGEILGVLLANIVNILNPDMIVLCGGVSQAGAFLINAAKKEMLNRAFKTPGKICKVISSKYTSRLGVVGAAMLAKQ
jgi:glucokinase